MFFQFANRPTAPAPPSPPSFAAQLTVVGVLLLLSLPNVVALFFAEDPVLARLLLIHGLGLLLLPAAFGLSVQRTLWVWLPFAIVVPASALYLIGTGHQPSEWTILVMAEASVDELSSFAAACIIIAVTTPLFFWATWFLIRKSAAPHLRLTRLGRFLVLVLALLLPALELATIGLGFGWEPGLKRLKNTFPFAVGLGLAEATRVKQQLLNRSTLQHDFVATPPADPTPDGTRDIHLLVLGETCRYGSFSIHGYERPTSPRLGSLPGLLDFTNVIAPGAYTTLSVPMLLTPTAPGTHLSAASSPSLINVFKKAGYRVYWISTQKKHGFGDTSCSLYAQDADESQFLSGIIDATGTGSYVSALDSALVPAVREVLERQEPRVLIVCHAMGSHSNYADRYPPEFEKYPVDRKACPVARRKTSLTSEDRLNLRNAYDNSILFTDHVLTELITVLSEQQNALATFCFVPDHGENTGDAPVLPFAHGINTVDVLHVPMFMWFSAAARQARPQQVARLGERVDTPFSSAHLFHTMIDLAGIHCSLTDPTNSLCNEAFKVRPRWVVNGDGDTAVDYDLDVLALEQGRKGWRPLFPKRQTAQK